jgi:glucuronate isomerase
VAQLSAAVTETAALYNLAGFVDDARALTALTARHDPWRVG